jgi:HSP20 family protein
MSLIRFDPFQEISRIENRMKRIFDDTFGDRQLAISDRVYSPLVDIRETDDKFMVEADMPGFKKDEIQIDLTRESLELKASKKEEKEVKKEGYLHRERYAKEYHRKINFPTPIDIDKVTSSYKDGTLKMEFPKIEEAKKKRISLN